MGKNKVLMVVCTLVLGIIMGVKFVQHGYWSLPGIDKESVCEQKKRALEKKACYSKK